MWSYTDPPIPAGPHSEQSLVPLPPDRTALRAALQVAVKSAQADGDPHRAIDFYRFALGLSWTHMSRVVGTLGARTIADHAARVASRKCADLKLVDVSDRGLDFTSFLSPDVNPDPVNQQACMEELCLSVFGILGELTGDVILGPLLEKLKEAQANPS